MFNGEDEIKYNSYLSNFRKYKTFLKSMIKKYVGIPFVGSTYVSQGVCRANNYTLITFYDYTKVNNSIICIVDDSSREFRIVYLDGKYHCGGIGYHEKSNSIYAKGNYTDKDVERNVLSNPFKRFEDMNMFRHTKTLGIIEVDSTIWKKLSVDDKTNIVTICDNNLEKYYQRISK